MDAMVGEIRLFAFAWAPVGWARCDGTLLSIEQYPVLFAAIGSQYGGDGTHTFALPDLRGRTPVHSGVAPEGFSVQPGEAGGQHQVTLTEAQIAPHSHSVRAHTAQAYRNNRNSAADATAPSAGVWQIPISGVGQGTFQLGTADIDSSPNLVWAQDTVGLSGQDAAHPNMQPSLVINACIAIEAPPKHHYQGEIRLFATEALPQGWLPCDGRQLSVEKHDNLYSLLGNWFGGDGVHEFALPDLRGRVPIHAGKGPGNMSPLRVGTPLGTEMVALTTDQMPAHRHQLPEPSAAPTDLPSNEGDMAPVSHVTDGSTPQTTALHAEKLGQSGLSEAHDNMMPSITLQYAIAIEGEYPPEP